MYEPHVDHHLAPGAFPAALRVLSIVVSVALVSGFVAGALSAAARIVA